MRPHPAHRVGAAIGDVGVAEVVHEAGRRGIDDAEPLHPLQDRRRDVAAMLDPHAVVGPDAPRARPRSRRARSRCRGRRRPRCTPAARPRAPRSRAASGPRPRRAACPVFGRLAEHRRADIGLVVGGGAAGGRAVRAPLDADQPQPLVAEARADAGRDQVLDQPVLAPARDDADARRRAAVVGFMPGRRGSRSPASASCRST